MYRINFGNGQVHGTFETFAEAMRAYFACGPDGHTFIQRYEGGGEWSKVRIERQRRAA